jgi:hypothetical protein
MAMPAAHSGSTQQHQAASLDQDSAVAEGPSVDSWSEKDQRIVVSQPASGFLYDLILRAKVRSLLDLARRWCCCCRRTTG